MVNISGKRFGILNTRVSYYILIVSIGILIFGTAGWFLFLRYEEAGKFWGNYHQLQTGMTYAQVKTIWGDPYAKIVIPGRGEVWCYKNEGHPIYIAKAIFFDWKPGKSGSVVSDKLENINENYSDAELLFNLDGHLEAFACVGEETHVHTAKGEIEGSNLGIYAKYK